ncbi:RHS repeat-associated core domain-containing protein [Pseudomonas mangiferae]|nr:RHS repeat-associated core domain-containing protein [Pseudomonas mangiferae]
MGDPIKAERTPKHFAAVVSPALAATPFGTRPVPSTPAVSFAMAEGVAQRTYGNSANLFLLRSTAIDSGKMFKPTEFLPQNPVEGSFSTSHGHVGVISGPSISPCPGAINCGVLPGPNAKCSAELEGLLEALADRMANEFMNNPLSFLLGFKSAHDKVVADLVVEKGKGYWDSIKGGAQWVWGGVTKSADYLANNDIGTIANDAKEGVEKAYDASVAFTTDVMEAIDELSQLSLDEIKAIIKDWLRELLDDLACSAQELLASMLADPKPMAEQLGEAAGAAEVHVAETVVIAVATRGAGGAASKVGQLIGKTGNRIGDLYERLKRATKKPRGTKPSHDPKPKPVPKKPTPEQERPHDKDGVQGKEKGEAKPNCLNCALATPKPVNAIYGAKLLSGGQDLDFVLEAPLPLAWQRTYASNNPNVSWLGQGWSVPIGFRLDVESQAIVFVDLQGRRTSFPDIAVGERFFSRYEFTTLQRNQRNQYEVIAPDGLRLIFGLAPRDQAALGEREVDEAHRQQREALAWERLLASRAAQGEEPLAAPESDPKGLRPQADSLVLLGFIDPNHNHLRLHYAEDGLPYHLDTSSGRRLGFLFDRSRPREPRLTHVVELFGQPDAAGHYPREQQQWLVKYCYSAEGDLVEVRDGNGQVCRTFAWANHMLMEHTEPGGLVSRYEWDRLTPKGKVLRNTLSNGQRWTFVYDELARETQVTDAENRVVLYRYDEDDRLVGKVDALGGESRYELDPYGNLLASTDPAGRTTRFQYDARGNLTCLIQPDGASYRFTWDETWRKPTSITDPLGRTTQYRYDTRGNLVELVEPDGGRTDYRLDARGLPTALVDARGGVKTFDFDAQGRLLGYTDCSGSRTGYAYDAHGNLVSATDALGHTTQYRYTRVNRRFRLSHVRHADGGEERFAYDPLGRLVAHHDPLGRATRYRLDAEGRPLERIDALGHRLGYRYDLHGRLATLTNENGALYRFAWDPLDRLVAEQGFDGRRIDYRYDAAGHLLESADGVPLGLPLLGEGSGAPILRTRYARDAMGRMLDKYSLKPDITGRPQVAHSRYAYDAAGQLVRARNRQARVELYYNQGGRLSREVLRGRGGQFSELQHRYDLLGNREATVLPDGRTLNTLTYGSGHVHQINLDFQTICDFERDALHREVGRSQGALFTQYSLDPLGRLLQSQARLQREAAEPLVGPGADSPASQGQRIARRYQYDLAGQLTALSDRRQGVTQYGYDALGRLRAALSPRGEELFAFDPAHNLMEPDQAQREDVRARKTQWTEEEWTAYVQANLHNPDFNPLLTPAEAASDPSTWGENRPNRLRVWQEHRYAYDQWGNCVEKKSGPNQVRHFEWDAEHRLSRATIETRKDRFVHQERWGYDYDPFGRRIAKYRLDRNSSRSPRPWQDPDARHFAWDGNRLLMERQGQRQSLYVYEAPDSFVPLALVRSEGTLPAREEDIPLPAEWLALKDLHPEQWAATTGALQRKIEAKRQAKRERLGRSDDVEAQGDHGPAEILYFHTDHLGTPRELTDGGGRIVWSATYKAWGNAYVEHPAQPVRRVVGNTQLETWEATSEPVQQNLRFQGQYFDGETGLHYNRFRYYDPDIGRFVSQDPIGLLGGDNSYQYAPNPIGWIDPLGLNRFKRSKWGPCQKGTGLDYVVFQQDIDWDLAVKGKTNLERAAEGGAPFIMKNGSPQQVQLHHSRQQSVGPLFEVTTSTHRAGKGKGREAMHPYGNSKNPEFPVDRDAFDIDRKQYWKDRAAAEKIKRAGGC